MSHSHQAHHSFWQRVQLPTFPSLRGKASTDVAIVGAGIAGLTTAYILLKNGFEVIVIDKDDLGYGETARTSAHLSDILDEGFQELIRLHGEEGAQKAFASHSDAIDLIEKIIAEEFIDCDFSRVDGYLYISSETDMDFLQKEFEASLKAGVQEMEVQASPRFFPQLGPALRYGRQARLHPLKYLAGLIEAILKMGGKIYGSSRAIDFGDGEYPFVRTADDAIIQAKHIVVCSNVPVNDRFQIHTKQAAYRSYVIGMEIPENTFPDILLWDTSKPYHYVRKIENTRPGFDTLLVGGEDHRVGQADHPEQIFARLQNWFQNSLKLQGTLTYKWSGQIIEPVDGLAYIGLNPGDEKTVISCGDSGHGLTHAGITAMITRDLLQGSPNEWVDLYSPSRMNLKATKKYIQENANTMRQYKDRLHLSKDLKHEHLIAGEGTLVEHGTEKFALYKDNEDQLFCFRAVCPHLGGVVHWNSAERTWDCPCHGSRFSATGEVLNGPAIIPLTAAPLPPTLQEDRRPEA
ncbi:Gamma-glutamylputrescine oxidoreductase [compost metagenome]